MTDALPELLSETRQSNRLAATPELYRTAHERLCVELALDVDDVGDVFASYGYDADQAIALASQPAFQGLLSRIRKEVQESGVTFRQKARVLAESFLPHVNEMATDPQCSSAVRADLIKWCAKVAGLEPKETKDDGKVGGGLSLNITFAGQAPQQIVAGREPVLIEQEG